MPELRKDPITQEWVIIATERGRRPSDFTHLTIAEPDKPEYSPTCPFCPGKENLTPPEVLAFRHSLEKNSSEWWVRVVPNKFPALAIEGELEKRGVGMYDLMNGVGAHEVIIETQKHNLDPSTVSRNQLAEVLWAYRERYLDLRKDSRFKYILIFRNHGKVAGASLEHPHSQLIATPMIPIDVVNEIQGADRYFQYHDRCIWCDMIQQELSNMVRVVNQTEHFVAFEPFASKYPFETWLLPKKHQSSFSTMTRERVEEFGGLMQDALGRISRCLNSPPYNFAIHNAPCGREESETFHWHMVIMPRLTIAAGFEMGTGIYINVTSPEDAARYLREIDHTDELQPDKVEISV
ncbi:MAG TPA: galactose-1-phosphate uridylyltransferase [Armatimonadota bacterium]|nr:galactose-1-phosphate uridylyltransferase [Armatimonadota bacterium]